VHAREPCIRIDDPVDFGDVAGMSEQVRTLRDFIYLDVDRLRSMAAQLDVSLAWAGEKSDRATHEQLFNQVEPALLGRPDAMKIDAGFDYTRWAAENFHDGQFVLATGSFRLLDFTWLAMALNGLPAVLRKMSKIEMAALKNSEQGRRMSKSALQQRSLENQSAIAKVEEFKIDELSDVVQKLYAEVVRVKVRPSRENPGAVLVGSAYVQNFYDSPAALSQKYGVEIDAGWAVVGQLNVSRKSDPPQPIPTGNQMEDAFEQIALLMNNAFKLANAPVFPALSMTPIAIYRTAS